MSKCPRVCLTCEHYSFDSEYRCKLKNAYIGYAGADEPNNCEEWELNSAYKEGGKFYKRGKND